MPAMMGESDRVREVRGYRRGDVVVVRSLEEILATLDAEATLEGMPFMPEMASYCGKTFRVRRRAEKTCVEGIGMRALKDCVFLEGLRCDGAAHDGCQRGCFFFWKEAWLQPAGEKAVSAAVPAVAGCSSPFDKDSSKLPASKNGRFFCQSTELAAATTDFPPGKLGHYLRDVRLGELTWRRFAFILWRSLTNRAWRLWRGRDFYQVAGQQTKTLSEELNLKPGEWVEVKSLAEIQATLDAGGCNRGLSFEPEMALYCGRRYRVASPVERIILEKTGEMARLRNTVILDGIACQGLCSMNCPRANFLYWRECWLRRV